MNEDPSPQQPLPAPDRHLRAVDTDTGEVVDARILYATIADLEQQVKALTTEKRGWQTRYYKAMDDREAKAQGHQLWGKAIALFTEWRIATGRMRSKWSADRFWLCEPYLRSDGYPLCRCAVWGIAAHPNQKPITNGYVEVYNDFELCFRNRSTFERYCRRGVAIFGIDPPQPPPGAES